MAFPLAFPIAFPLATAFTRAWRPVLAACLASAAWLGASPADAAETEATLARIARTGTMTIGVRQSSIPFSYVPEGKEEAIGYSVDLCQRVAEGIRQQLRLPALKIQQRVVTPSDRMERLEDGSIDLECGSTTNTRDRQQRVAFSYTTFVTGMRLVTRRDAGIGQVEDLVGKTVVTTKGTSAEKLLLREGEIGWMRGVKLAFAPDHDESFRQVAAGTATAFAMDDILLAGLVTRSERPDDFAIVGRYLTVEPYALMFRKDDPAFAELVNRSLKEVLQSDEIHSIYKKWFLTATLHFPMSHMNRETFQSPNTTPAFP